MLHRRRSRGAVDIFMLLLMVLVVATLVVVGMMVKDGQMTPDTMRQPMAPRMGGANLTPAPLTEADLEEAQQELLASIRANLEDREAELARQLSRAEQREQEAGTAYQEYQKRLAAMNGAGEDEVVEEQDNEIQTTNEPRPAPTPR